MKLIHNISRLHGIIPSSPGPLKGEELRQDHSISDAWLLIEGGTIAGYGTGTMPEFSADIQRIDAKGGMLMPGFCDSHTHLVYAQDRQGEFQDRIEGLSYEDIAKRGGGILNSVEKLRNMSEEELFSVSFDRLKKAIALGTTSFEIKSGYGLDMENERKMLRVARRLAEEVPVNIRTSLLAAHAFPNEYLDDHDGYVQHIVERIIPEMSEEGLVDYIDVFCERGYFSAEQTDAILGAGVAHGWRPKTHVNQFSSCGGVQVSLKHGALSLDHLEVMSPEDLKDIIESGVIATALPACSFFLAIPYTPARDIIDGGGAIALATDYNPGSSPCPDMGFVWSLACIKMKMRPLEAMHALTYNGAAAMGLEHKTGSIAKGKDADLILSKPLPELASIPYRFAQSFIKQVFVKGKVWQDA